MEESVTATTETKNIVNPRVEIDTSPPFESVKEAVDRFGGRGPWIPYHLLRLAAHPHNSNTDDEEFNVEKMEELERDLIIKERQTLNVLKEVESAKRLVEGLKFNLIPEFMASPDPNCEIPMINDCNDLLPALSPGLMFMELNRAKSNLNKTSIDLAVIQESVESLNKKMTKDKVLVERRMKLQIPNSEGVFFSRNPKVEEAKGRSESCTNMSMDLKQVDFETEQFKKMTEASRYEVMKAMTEIERTKNSIKMAEMRLNAAKKMEEAAKAVEAIALAERNSDQNSSHNVFLPKISNGITLSFEEYRSLTQKAQQVEELCKTKFIDSNTIQTKNEDHHQSEVAIMEKFEETKQESQQSREDRYSKFKFRNSHSGHRSTQAVPEIATTSIGDILGRKVILQDDIIVGKHVENHSEREHISLSQMLREQSRLILHPTKSTADGNVEKSYFVQRKKFGFIQVPLSIKKTKKKTQPLNVR